MSNISIHRLTLRLMGFVGALFVVSSLWAQQTPQNFDDNYAYGNAPYSNAYPAEHKAFEPFAPVGFTQKLQPFAPADVSDYGNGPKARRGFFFSYERLEWSISRPTTAPIGSADAVGFYQEPPDGDSIYETNSVDTSEMKSKFGPGNRWEFGYMDFNDYGWLCSIIDHVNINQYYVADCATVLFNDPQQLLTGYLEENRSSYSADPVDKDLNNNGIFGRDGVGTPNPDPLYTTPYDPSLGQDTALFPIGDRIWFIPKFQTLRYSQNTLMSGAEVMRMYRLPRLHHGGIMELIYGMRFLQFQDKFYIIGLGTAEGYPVELNPLADFALNMRVQNNIIGPQIGLRYFHQRGRWIFNSEARVFTAANFQNSRQDTVIGTQLPTGETDAPIRNRPNNLTCYGTRSWNSQETFTPGVELRIGTTYMITRAFALKMGYTAMYLGGIARAANRIDYSLPAIGIVHGNNHQNVFINGVSVGFEFAH